MKILAFVTALTVFVSAEVAAENNDADKKKKTPHATIVVRPGPPVKPTGPAKPVGNQKSDWGGTSGRKASRADEK